MFDYISKLATSKFANYSTASRFSTLFSVFGNPDETLALVFEILYNKSLFLHNILFFCFDFYTILFFSASEVERIVTPETSYENLVAMQCAEIEEAMMNEVQRFYIAWNKKLEDLKRKNAGGQMSPNDVNVMGLGVSGGDMRSM